MICNSCGARIPENNEICPKCGSLVAAKTAFSRTREKPRRRKTVLIPIICVLSVTVLAISALMIINASAVASRYDSALVLINTDPAKAKEEFAALGNYKDAGSKAELCQTMLDYQNAKTLMDSGDFSGAESAFKSLGDYEDSASLAGECRDSINYSAAKALFDKGDYKNAQAAFKSLGSFNFSDLMAQYCGAAVLRDNGNLKDSLAVFRSLGSFLDSANQATECEYKFNYAAAKALYDEGEYENAKAAFALLGPYNGSDEMALRSGYAAAEALYEKDDYEDAIGEFAALGDYKDSKDMAKSSEYNLADSYYKSGNYFLAAQILKSLGDYKDSAAKRNICAPIKTCEIYHNPNYRSKSTIFEINARTFDNSYLKIYDGTTLVSTVFLASGGNVDVKLPPGTYNIKNTLDIRSYDEQDLFSGNDYMYFDRGSYKLKKNYILSLTF